MGASGHAIKAHVGHFLMHPSVTDVQAKWASQQSPQTKEMVDGVILGTGL